VELGRLLRVSRFRVLGLNHSNSMAGLLFQAWLRYIASIVL